ncbi:penicillin-binding protein activator LpoB [Spongiibacter sp. KMU-158]|uniref:Penicillin-binding protein activator LpoB n=1 Tax=Spongiibacter pelagi TaxID=2760804 RepID=A0A927C0Q3_9GAMM|nr:penicillin-binding protein activator LpoB [Spongiibacter pelagi]MBD2857742.1 penicillin-binding protein activator LpoB [Spongiibacter pelagi]
MPATLWKKFSLALVLLTLVGCGGAQVKRVEDGKATELTDKWSPQDSQIVAEAMITDMLSFPWIEQADRKPAVTVQYVRNRSHEQIPVDSFVNSIKRELLRSGKVDFVVSGDERERVRDEKLDQEMNASMETAVDLGEETAANFALSGMITSFVDQLQGKRAVTYQVDLKLIDLESNREVWNGQKQIRKVSSKSAFSL